MAELTNRAFPEPMKAGRLLPYLTAFLLLAWILGSLARGGTRGGSILSNSYWLVYAVELLPLIGLGLVVILGIYLAINWRLLSDALAFGISQRRRQKKGKRTLPALIFIAAWAVAIMILWLRCKGLVCDSSAHDTAAVVKNFVSGNGPFPQIPALSSVLALASLLDTNIFAYAFFGIVAVSSVIMVRAIKVHISETGRERLELVQTVQDQGRRAVEDAMRVLDEDENMDPRTRIIHSYQKMIVAAASLGAPVGLDKTARELESGIRNTFMLKGMGIARLTGLFEVARYSLHTVTAEDGSLAREYLMEISGELAGRTVSPEA